MPKPFCARLKRKKSPRRCLLHGVAFAAFAAASCSAQADSLWPALSDAVKAASAVGSPTAPADIDPDTDLLLLNAPPKPQKAPAPPAAVTLKTSTGSVQIKKFKRLRWSPGENVISSDGPVDVIYTQAGSASPATLEVNNLNYDFDTGVVKASKGVRLTRAEEVFTGDAIEFDLTQDTGFVTEATVSSQFFRIAGKRIEAQANQTYVVTEGTFTTCERYHPDYHIAAKRLTVAAGKYVSARNITFYFGSSKLISLPSYRRNLNRSASVPTPRPGYSKSEGF